MNFLGEGLNPIYILTAIILVTYLHIVGLAANKKIRTTIPSILMGLLTSLVISSPLILAVHGGYIDHYFIYYLIIILLILILSTVILFKDKIDIKVSKKLLLCVVIYYIFELIFIDSGMYPGHDYGLYGQGFESGSKFIANNTPFDRTVNYMFTILYRGLGSFSGLILGPTEMTNETTHLNGQVVLCITWASIVIQSLLKFIPNIKYRAILPPLIFASIFLKSFNVGFYGSHSLYLIFIVIILSDKKLVRNTLVTSLSFIFLASTAIVIMPMAIISLCVIKSKRIMDYHILKWSPIIVSLIISIIVFVNSGDFNNLDQTYFVDKWIALVPSIVSVMVILTLSKNSIKQLFLVNSIFALVANLIINYNGNITGVAIMPTNIIHRYMQSFLAGELHNSSVILFTLPGAMHLLYEHFKTKKDLK